MTVHDFDERLAFSHMQSDQSWWETVYRQAFPDMVSMIDLRHDGWHQRAGRDRAVVLSSGRTLYVDEKVRAKDYGDIAIELWSKYPLSGKPPYSDRADDGPVEWMPGRRAEPGWAMRPIDCDWLAYAMVPTSTCYLIPFFGLRAAMAKSASRWISHATNGKHGIRWVAAKNRTWLTVSLAVPMDILKAAIDSALTVTWSATTKPVDQVSAADPPAEPYEDTWPEVRRPPDWQGVA